MTNTMKPSRMSMWADHIEARRERYGIPCIAAGIVRGGKLWWFHGFGETTIGNGKAPDEYSRFRIASNTKPFTATALMSMADASMLTLEDPLMLYIPEFTSAATPAGELEDVTLRRLATHHSGLVTEHPDTDWSNHAFPTMSHILETVHEISVVIPHDRSWKYSNLAYGLLGEVIERLSGRSFQRWITDEILNPLGLSDTVFTRDELPTAHRTTGYLPPRPGSDAPRRAPDFSLNGVQAAGELWSNVNDLARWVGYMMSDNASTPCINLSRHNLNSMLRPVYVDADWNRGQCVGWRTERIANTMCHTHGGGIHGFGTATMWSKSQQLGVIVLTSLWPGTGAAEIARDLMAMVVNNLDAPPTHCESDAVSVQSDPGLKFVRFAGHNFAEPGLSRTITAISGGRLHLGTEESAVDGRIEVIAFPNEDGSFTVNNGRAAGESITFNEDLSFQMSNFTYERVEDA